MPSATATVFTEYSSFGMSRTKALLLGWSLTVLGVALLSYGIIGLILQFKQ